MYTYKSTITTLKPFSIGLDNFFQFAENYPFEQVESKFPSYNIINVDNKNYLIEMALAGYKKEDINIEHKDGVINVSYTKPKANNPLKNNVQRIVHNGITKKSFSKDFAVADTIIVKGATFVDGLLTISLEDIVEETKSNKIQIS